jgi:hypothetical protein
VYANGNIKGRSSAVEHDSSNFLIRDTETPMPEAIANHPILPHTTKQETMAWA